MIPVQFSESDPRMKRFLHRQGRPAFLRPRALAWKRVAPSILWTVSALAACEAQTVEPTVAERVVAEDLETSSQTYGELRQPNGPVIPLAEIAAQPTPFEGRQIRTEGEIQRVCQKKGCWIELSDASGARAFVPMAGHAFAVPMDSSGRKALVEGIVHRRERSVAELEHLKDDGASDGVPSLSIEANAVVIR